jgi:hypothetical protein
MNRYTTFLLNVLLTIFVVFVILLILAAWPHRARADGYVSHETCESYQRATGTVVTECRAPGRKPRVCTGYTSITGTLREECR